MRIPRRARASWLLLAAFVAGAARRAAAQELPGPVASDPTAGRIEGDVSVVGGLGATVGPRGPRGALDFRVRYLETAGFFAAYEDASVFGAGAAAEPMRVVSTGLELRPLFLGRWLSGLEWGAPRADLLVDSLGFEVGVYFYQPKAGAFASTPGLQAGLGIEVPILARASGPWIGLHGGVRWGPAALAEVGVAGPDDRSLYLTITLAYHGALRAHVIDEGDRAPR